MIDATRDFVSCRVLPLPISALPSASVALRNPADYYRAVPLTFDQFRFGFATP